MHHVNKWDCRLLSRRIIDPNKVRILKERLFAIEQSKILSVNNAVQVAKTPAERKKATQARSLLMKYGSSVSCNFLMINHHHWKVTSIK